jgi:arylsulfatase A-like enzyme
MNRPTPVDQATSPSQSAQTKRSSRGPSALDVLAFSAWCGLAGGLLEVGTRILCRAIDPTKRLYLITRHFVWLTPLVNLLVFLCLGLCLAGLTKLLPRLGARLSPWLLCGLALLPILIVAGPHIYPEARLILAMGISSWLVPWFAPYPAGSCRLLLRSFLAMLGLVMVLAISVFSGDWLKKMREAGHPLPPANSPNVLFIVLDTIRADRLSLYGYHRSTTPTLDRLAKRGIRFDAARASAPWTLTSHTSFFTGHWPHELDIQWQTPPRKHFPMVAEYLANHGYATAGLVSNATHCSYDTGLGRGFAHYEDYVLDQVNILRTAVIVGEIRKTAVFLLYLALRHDTALLRTVQDFLGPQTDILIRRDAQSVNRGFLTWLDHRRDPRRPFFAFLNYLDAHVPYELPPGVPPRFGQKPRTRDELQIVYDRWSLIDKLQLPPHYMTLALDAYDNCISYLDERLGELFDELGPRGVLEKTWVVIVGDHGEGLGEHDLFEHGESLYSTEIHVPLLVLPPGNQPGRVVRDTVSLRDLPATVVDLVGIETGAPFPGRSLARLWKDAPARGDQSKGDDILSELPSPSPRDSSHGRSPARRGPLVSVAEGDLVYIKNEGDGTEELYDGRVDPRELTNLAGTDAMRPVLERFRQQLARLKPSPGHVAR